MGIQKKPYYPLNKLAGIVAALLCFYQHYALLLLSKPVRNRLSTGLFTDLSGPFHLYATPAFRDVSNAANDVKEVESIANNESPCRGTGQHAFTPETAEREKEYRGPKELEMEVLNNTPSSDPE
jgi:hypothetical protein